MVSSLSSPVSALAIVPGQMFAVNCRLVPRLGPEVNIQSGLQI